MLSSKLEKLIVNHTLVEWLPNEVSRITYGGVLYSIPLSERRSTLTLITRHNDVVDEIRTWMASLRSERAGPYHNIYPTSINIEAGHAWHYPKYTITFECMGYVEPIASKKPKSFFPPELFEL